MSIPRTCQRRNDLSFAQLLFRVRPGRIVARMFEGVLLKPGALIDEAALWPTSEYPKVPLLLEYAGTDGSGRGHLRSSDVRVLWRYERERAEWIEIVRCTTQGTEWVEHLQPIISRALAAAPRSQPERIAHAAGISGRIISLLDDEMDKLDPEERELLMDYVYQELNARAVKMAA